jgi:DNA repair exonuclease SbcCD ATPase subunit
MCEQNKTLQAELNTQKEILENHIADLHQRETGFKAVMKRFWEDLDSRELAINIAIAKADEVNRNLSVRKKEFDSRARAIEIKEADLKRREQNLLPLEKQLADQKTSIQAQAAEAQESLTNAQKRAVTILDQAKQDAQITVLRAEADAADVIEGAAQEAREMVFQARAQCKDLWGWCHYKAQSADVTPAEWQEVKRVRQESRKLRQTQGDGSPGDDTDDQLEVTNTKVGLSGRQVLALNHIREHGNLTIQDFEKICPDVNRRTLQRDLKAMVDSGILFSTGASNQLIYHLAKSCDIATANLRHG